MAAGAAHRDRADDHQLVEALGVGEFSDRGLLHIAAPEHLLQVHLGHAARGVLRVVVAHGVNDHAVQHALHLDLDLVQQPLQFAGFDELGNVVVGMEALARCTQAFANFDGDGRSFVGRNGAHFRGCFSEHGNMLPANLPCSSLKVFSLQPLPSLRKQLSIK